MVIRRSVGERRNARKTRISVIVFGVACCLFGLFQLALSRTQLTDPFLSFAVVDSSVKLVFMEPAAKRVSVISVPDSVQITGIHDVGTYSLSSLWKLQHMTGVQRTMFTDSVTSAFGVPVLYALRDAREKQSTDDLAVWVKQYFTVGLLQARLHGNIETSMPLTTLTGVVRFVQSVKHEDIHIVDLAQAPVYQTRELEDGSSVRVLDTGMIDHFMNTKFELESVVAEGKNIVILNTTDKAGVGQTISRILTRMGMHVVAVQNDEQKISGCVLEGPKESLSSKTAVSIRLVYGCAEKVTQQEGLGDITVKIGDSTAKRLFVSE